MRLFKHKFILLGVALSGVFCGEACCGQIGDRHVDSVINVQVDNVIENNFLGAGVQWSSYPWWDISGQEWEKVFGRVQYMKLPFTRVMLSAFWYCEKFDEKGEPVYHWDSSYMKKLYTLLDWCQANNVMVMIGEWGRPAGKKLNLENNDPRWSRIVGDFIEHMLNDKKYTCIKYYNLINEPHGDWTGVTWDDWKTAIDNLHKELLKRKLNERILIASPDADRKWTTKVLRDDQLRNQTAIYDEHWYVYASEIERGNLELYTRDQLRQIKSRDAGKQFFLGELGLVDGKTKNDQQPHVYDFWYGVSMADAAVQLIRGGAAGFLAWNLDDAMHFYGDGGEGPQSIEDKIPANAYENRKIWGMWNIIGSKHGNAQDENMRPWYYAWSQVSRCFPPGSQILETDDADIYQLRVAAARIPSGGKYGVSFAISFAIVNNYDRKLSVMIKAPKVSGKISLARYDYFDTNGDNKVDSWPDTTDKKGQDKFPKTVEVLKDVDLKDGIIVQLPSKGVVFLTSIETKSFISLN